MKLTKNKLLKLIRNKVISLGYTEFKDSLMGTDGFFVKCVRKGFFLSLSFEISRYYDSRFTASYYLSKTTRWGAIWGDIPNECYKRVGAFLTKEERELYLDAEHSKEGVIDSWWNANYEVMVQNFFETLEITESRFLNQKDLFYKIENSMEINQLADYSSGVIALVDGKKVDDNYQSKFVPNKPVDGVPLDWFKAAELVLLKQKGILNVNTVKLLGVDAWRQYRIRQVQ